MELKGVARPAALLSGRAGASVSVGMATRRLGWPAVVAAGAGRSTEGGGTGGPPIHEDTRLRRECLERDEPPGPPHHLMDPVAPSQTLGWGGLNTGFRYTSALPEYLTESLLCAAQDPLTDREMDRRREDSDREEDKE